LHQSIRPKETLWRRMPGTIDRDATFRICEAINAAMRSFGTQSVLGGMP
jgi:hypothetical protein